MSAHTTVEVINGVAYHAGPPTPVEQWLNEGTLLGVTLKELIEAGAKEVLGLDEVPWGEMPDTHAMSLWPMTTDEVLGHLANALLGGK